MKLRNTGQKKQDLLTLTFSFIENFVEEYSKEFRIQQHQRVHFMQGHHQAENGAKLFEDMKLRTSFSWCLPDSEV